MGSFIQAFKSRRVALLLPLGFASGLPLLLTGSTLSAWMALEGVDLKTIGFFAAVTLPYNLKFLWAPVLDRYAPHLLGRRRGWMLLAQLGLVAALFALSLVDPVSAPLALALIALGVCFLSATQDIVADAYRTDVLPDHERGSGTATFVTGYRVAMLVAGAGALILADHIPWRTIYWIMAALMLVGVVATWAAPEPAVAVRPPRTLTDAVVHPFVDFFTRRGALVVLFVVALYKFGDAVASHLVTPFLLGDPAGTATQPGGLGFSSTEVGAINKGLGLAATIVGALVGGGFVARLGVRKALLLFGFMQAGANVGYMALAAVGPNHALLVAAIGIDQFCGGLGTAAFVAFLMSLCNQRFSATQYALLSSASSLVGKLIGTVSGVVVVEVGWFVFFAISIVVALPALAVLAFLPADAARPPAEPDAALNAPRSAESSLPPDDAAATTPPAAATPAAPTPPPARP